MKVRLYAHLREIAGTSEIDMPRLHSVPQLIAALSERYGNEFFELSRRSCFYVDGERVESALPSNSSEVAILPPVSGGC